MIKDLVYKSPESEGVSSRSILKFIRFVEENKINLHSFLFSRGGNIIVEGYYPPYDENFLHRLYSSTKTYVALAVGMLVTEGKLNVKDKVLSFFPELDTPEVDDLMRECTVEDALMMCIPYYSKPQPELPEYCGNRFAVKCEKPAGTIFNYGEGAAMVTAVVERVSGMYLTDYLRPLFDKIGVSQNTYCLKNYDGVAWGASGMMTTLRDFAKVAELVGNRGKHGKEQLIDREYMELMTSVRTSTVSTIVYSPIKHNGYGYQTWVSPDAICMRGMGCQEAFYFTDKDLLFVCNGATMTDGDYSDIRLYDAVKYLVYEEIGKPMAEGEEYLELLKKLQNLKLSRFGEPSSALAESITGVRYSLSENKMGWESFKLELGRSEGSITYRNKRGEKTIRFGMGEYLKCSFPETHYSDIYRGVPAERELDCLAIGEWIEEKKLLIRAYISDTSFGSLFIVIAFKGDKVAIQLSRNGQFVLEDYGGTALGKASV